MDADAAAPKVLELKDLEPQWLRTDTRLGVGLSFLCPCGCEGGRLYVLFINSLDGLPVLENSDDLLGNNDGFRWARSGLKFEDLSLHPDINASEIGHWHGRILEGKMLPPTS